MEWSRRADIATGFIATKFLLRRESGVRWVIAKKYDGSKSRRTGHPKTSVEIEWLVLRMASDNPSWGYTRICGALYNLGHELGRNTVKRILLDNGIDHAPVRNKDMSWKTFFKAHWGAIAATDFSSVEVVTRAGLVRHFVLFIIDLKTREVDVAGIVRQSD